jgi:hypothetical protein
MMHDDGHAQRQRPQQQEQDIADSSLLKSLVESIKELAGPSPATDDT